MSYDFKYDFGFGQPNQKEAKAEPSEMNYTSSSSVRNVCFEQTDGKLLFLNYSYLVSGEYLPDENSIVLKFTSHTITITGTQLLSLFLQLGMHLPRFIKCENERYLELAEKSDFVVTGIEIISKE